MDDIRDANLNSKLSWFAFHPSDFAGETQGLSVDEVGSYILLACYFAQMGGLPNDDATLTRIARRKNLKDWKAIRRVLEPFFAPNGRLATEVNKAHAKREERAASGRKGGLARASKAQAQLEAQLNQPEPEPEKVRGYREESTPSSKGRANSLEGSATVQEEASTRGNGTRAFGVVDGGLA